ncbi:MAG: lysophospholipid acyltransferase family protein [Spirochaetaceae bacterium]
MLRTIAFFLYLGVVMLATVFFFPVLGLVGFFGGARARERYLWRLTSGWARHLLCVSGVPVEVRRLGDLPTERALCVVSNHQSAADILLVVGYVPRLLGFMAKRELKHVPVISWWMQATHCVFIERRSAAQALRAIDYAAQRIRDGQAMIVFPEGTRSRGRRMGLFKPGSMKLPKDAGAAILPVTIDGTYRLFEETGGIRPAPVRITFHPAVPGDKVMRLSRRELAEHLEAIIARPLEQPAPSKAS